MDQEPFHKQNEWAMSMFVEKSLTGHAKEMIEKCIADKCPAQKIWDEVRKNAETSATAESEAAKLLEKTSCMKWSQSAWSGNLESHVRKWHNLMSECEKPSGTTLHDQQKLVMTKASCSSHPALRQVETTSQQL